MNLRDATLAMQQLIDNLLQEDPASQQVSLEFLATGFAVRYDSGGISLGPRIWNCCFRMLPQLRANRRPTVSARLRRMRNFPHDGRRRQPEMFPIMGILAVPRASKSLDALRAPRRKGRNASDTWTQTVPARLSLPCGRAGGVAYPGDCFGPADHDHDIEHANGSALARHGGA